MSRKLSMLCSGMLLVGLTGGIATGKSTVARVLRTLGAFVIDADQLAHEVVEPEKPAYREIVKTFGNSIVKPDGTLSRSALGQIVFRNPKHLRQLNAIVHPRVAREQARLTTSIAQEYPKAIIIYDAPMLIEAEAHHRMDRLIVVTSNQRTQVARLYQRNRLTRAEALRRIRSQLPLANKVKLADFVIDGTLPRHALRQQVRRIKTQLDALT